MSKTSSRVKQRYNEANYKRFTAFLRFDEDADIIKYVEEHKGVVSATDYFRRGVQEIRKERK